MDIPKFFKSIFSVSDGSSRVETYWGEGSSLSLIRLNGASTAPLEPLLPHSSDSDGLGL